MGKAILEAKLAQQLVRITHEPLFQVFLDVQKVCDSLDRGQCMEIMRGYRMVQNMARLIAHHWESFIFVPKGGIFLETAFGTGKGFTQGYLVYPMIFNIVVDAVARAVLELICGPQEVWHRMGWLTGERKVVFYVYYGRIAGRGHFWLQDTLMATVAML